jgi:hypothetical protein
MQENSRKADLEMLPPAMSIEQPNFTKNILTAFLYIQFLFLAKRNWQKSCK